MAVQLDPVEQMLADEARADHAKAKSRGERLRLMADGIVNNLIASGALPAQHARQARVETFHQLADELYGNASVDGPSTAWEGWR